MDERVVSNPDGVAILYYASNLWAHKWTRKNVRLGRFPLCNQLFQVEPRVLWVCDNCGYK